jgi:hypothetical protein
MYDLAKRAKSNSGVGARQRQKRLMKELRSMQAPGGLPVASGASVFVRSDEDRLDIVCATSHIHVTHAFFLSHNMIDWCWSVSMCIRLQ